MKRKNFSHRKLRRREGALRRLLAGYRFKKGHLWAEREAQTLQLRIAESLDVEARYAAIKDRAA